MSITKEQWAWDVLETTPQQMGAGAPEHAGGAISPGPGLHEPWSPRRRADIDSAIGPGIVVVGASAGGVEALTTLVQGLPPDLPAAVFVVLHVPAAGPSALPEILSRAGPLPAEHAVDGTPISGGRILVAPPDYHLLVQRGHARVVRGPRENRQRPALDPLFRTAARAYGRRVIGIVLSGMLDDGTAGLLAVNQGGGVTIVQDPADALFPSMPVSALARAPVDHVLPSSAIGAVIATIMSERAPEGETAMSDEEATAAAMAELDPEALHRDERPGTSSVFSCPECGGVLWEQEDAGLLGFRCRVGHAFSTDSLDADQAQAVEAAMWVALRGFEERVALADRLVLRSRAEGQDRVVQRFVAQAEEARQHAETMRRLLLIL